MIDVAKKILEKELITYENIKTSESGFSNLVFFVDDHYVIKILESSRNKVNFMNEIGFYNSHEFDFTPKVHAVGDYKDSKYIIMNKVEGEALYDIWHKLSDLEREDVLIQISYILQTIHKSQAYTFLDEQSIRDDLIAVWKKAFQDEISVLKSKGYETRNLLEYALKRIPIVFEESKLGLVYNDAHFDNFLYDGKSVKLIDFDRVLYTSIDYELLIIHTMVNNPKKFANERAEAVVNVEDYTKVLSTLRKEYPELFDFTYLDERLYIYWFFYTLRNIHRFKLDHLVQDMLDDFAKKVG